MFRVNTKISTIALSENWCSQEIGRTFILDTKEKTPICCPRHILNTQHKETNSKKQEKRRYIENIHS